MSLRIEQIQNLQNRALRDRYGLDSSTTGVLIREPYSDDDNYPLKKGDVITHIGEYDIDNVGIVRTVHNLRVSFQYLVPS